MNSLDAYEALLKFALYSAETLARFVRRCSAVCSVRLHRKRAVFTRGREAQGGFDGQPHG